MLVGGGDEPHRFHHPLRLDGRAPIVFGQHEPRCLLGGPGQVMAVLNVHRQFGRLRTIGIERPGLRHRTKLGILASGPWLNGKGVTP